MVALSSAQEAGEGATQLDSSPALLPDGHSLEFTLVCTCLVDWIMTLPEDECYEAAEGLNDPILKPQWDTCRNYPVTYFGKGKARNAREVCFCWK